MKYVILRKRSGADDDPFVEMAGARGFDDAFALPFEIAAADLHDRDAADLRRDPSVEDVIPSIPFTLIEPLDEPSAEPTAAAEAAWGIEAVGCGASPQTGAGVTVAVLDTGIDRGHPAFAGLAFAPDDLADFTVDEQGRPGSAPDLHGHGTHVAGTIFGREVNGARIGVAQGVSRVLIGKVLGANGGPTEAVLNAIEWALHRRADVISMSLGIDFPGLTARLINEGFPPEIAASRALEGYRSNVRLFDQLAALVEARVARGRGAILVAAAGNESRRDRDPRFTVAVSPPAAAAGFLAVGALSRTGNPAAPYSVASFSNTGCLISAPGVGIVSARLGGGLVAQSGTSMASPHVAGIVALWTQKLFPGHNRPAGWARDVRRAVESRAIAIAGHDRNDVGLGLAQAPR